MPFSGCVECALAKLDSDPAIRVKDGRRALGEIGPSRATWFQSAAALMFLLLARRKAADLGELGGKLGMPAGALAETVRQYNKQCRNGAGDP